MKQFIECDLLGNEIEVGGLRGKYQEPPFTVLDTRGGGLGNPDVGSGSHLA